MAKKHIKFWSLLLALVMVMSLLPMSALAEDADTGSDMAQAEPYASSAQSKQVSAGSWCTNKPLSNDQTITITSVSQSVQSLAKESVSYEGYSYSFYRALVNSSSADKDSFYKTGYTVANYFRLSGSTVQYSEDGSTWNNLGKNVIRFYYLQVTNLYSQISIEVEDWGTKTKNEISWQDPNTLRSISFNLYDEDTKQLLATSTLYYHNEHKGTVVRIKENLDQDYYIKSVAVNGGAAAAYTGQAIQVPLTPPQNGTVDIYIATKTANVSINYLDADTNEVIRDPRGVNVLPSYILASCVNNGQLTTDTIVDKSGLSWTIKLDIDGYKYDHAAVDGSNLNVYYVKDTSKVHDQSYTVEYYKDGARVEGDDVTVTKSVWINDTTVPYDAKDFSMAADKYTGYKFDSTAPATIPAAIADGAVIKVNYTVNKHIITYQITGSYFANDEYYKQDNVPYGTKLPLIADDMTQAGYTFSGWTGLPATMPDNDVTVTGSYTANPPIIIIPINPPTEIPDEDVPKDLNSTDHYVYIMGYPDGTVQPNGNITRAEVTTAFYRLLTTETRDSIFTSSKAPYSDIAVSQWFNKAIASMPTGKYVMGYPDGSFGANRNITRAEFVAIAARFMNAKDGTVTFSDVSTTNWAYQYISTAVSYGWIEGYEDGTFRPNQPITRAEAMTIINRMLNRGVDANGLMEGFKDWPDNVKGAWYYFDVLEATNDHEYTGARPVEQWTSLTSSYTYDIVKYERP